MSSINNGAGQYALKMFTPRLRCPKLVLEMPLGLALNCQIDTYDITTSKDDHGEGKIQILSMYVLKVVCELVLDCSSSSYKTVFLPRYRPESRGT